MKQQKNKKKTAKKPLSVSARKKKFFSKNAIRIIQKYYNTSEIVNPVGNSCSWNVNEEGVFDEEETVPFDIDYNSEEGVFDNKNTNLFGINFNSKEGVFDEETELFGIDFNSKEDMTFSFIF